MNNIIVLLMYCMETSLVLKMPISGHKATGIREVTASGSTSNIQYRPITAIMNPHLALSEEPSTKGSQMRLMGMRKASTSFQLALTSCSQGLLDLEPMLLLYVFSGNK